MHPTPTCHSAVDVRENSWRLISLIALLGVFQAPMATSASAASTPPTGSAPTTSRPWNVQTGQIETLHTADLTSVTKADSDFLAKGTISTATNAINLISAVANAKATAKLGLPAMPDLAKPSGAYVIHIVKWDHDGSSVTFSHWYLYDPKFPSSFGYWGGPSAVITRKAIAGEKSVTLIYVYLTSADDPTKDPLANNPPSYSVSITQGVPTWLTNLSLAASLATGGKLTFNPAANLYASQILMETPQPNPVVAYCSYKTFDTDYDVSSWQIQTSLAALDAKNSLQANAGGSDTVTYANEKPSLLDFSGAMPAFSYTDVVRTGSQPTNYATKSVVRQSPYVCLDVYWPYRVEPSLRPSCWMPHLTLGLPIGGKVLQHPMAGVAFSLKYFELFVAWAPDWENVGPAPSFKRHFVSHGTAVVQLTLTQLQALLGKGN